VHLKADKQQS